jgi:hypothetical protein
MNMANERVSPEKPVSSKAGVFAAHLLANVVRRSHLLAWLPQ